MANADSDVTTEFEERYRIADEPAVRRVEQRVIGADYGATSYTPRAQADQLGRMLTLDPKTRLLDLGCGAGWPGIYLAKSSGCSVVLIDRPFAGLRAAARRVHREGVHGLVVAASGAWLPFRNDAFDAIVSADVLC